MDAFAIFNIAESTASPQRMTWQAVVIFAITQSHERKPTQT
jgi:hypothetical protein